MSSQFSSFQLGPMLLVVIIGCMFFMVVAAFGFIFLTHARLEEELLEAQTKLSVMASTDALTGVMNRRGFEEMAAHDIQLAMRYGHAMSLIVFDLDHFKRINDTHGHAVGDAVLQGVARACRQAVREVDTVARWGGEEFAVLMPETGLEEARRTAERLRDVIGNLRPVPGKDVMATASFGVAEHQGETFEVLTDRADSQMYRAKREGRNRVCVSAD